MNFRMASSRSRGALIIGVLALVLDVGTTSVVTINGETSCSHTNLAGIVLDGCAVVAALAASWEAATGLTRYEYNVRKGVTWGVAAVAIVLGAIGLLKGFDVVMSPCG